MRTRLLICALLLAGCTDMKDQPRFEDLEANPFFEDGRASRSFVEGTVARGHLYDNPHLHEGLDENGRFVTTFPFPITEKVLARGRERYDIFCSPCHAQTGWGDGMIVRRGYKQPPSFHIDRLRATEVGYLFDVISNGYGDMASYAGQVRHEDRWAIVAYIRALQWSQHAPDTALPAEVRSVLEHEPTVDTRPSQEVVGHGDANHH